MVTSFACQQGLSCKKIKIFMLTYPFKSSLKNMRLLLDNVILIVISCRASRYLSIEHFRFWNWKHDQFISKFNMEVVLAQFQQSLCDPGRVNVCCSQTSHEHFQALAKHCRDGKGPTKACIPYKQRFMVNHFISQPHLFIAYGSQPMIHMIWNL